MSALVINDSGSVPKNESMPSLNKHEDEHFIKNQLSFLRSRCIDKIIKSSYHNGYVPDNVKINLLPQPEYIDNNKSIDNIHKNPSLSKNHNIYIPENTFDPWISSLPYYSPSISNKRKEKKDTCKIQKKKEINTFKNTKYNRKRSWSADNILLYKSDIIQQPPWKTDIYGAKFIEQNHSLSKENDEINVSSLLDNKLMNNSIYFRYEDEKILTKTDRSMSLPHVGTSKSENSKYSNIDNDKDNTSSKEYSLVECMQYGIKKAEEIEKTGEITITEKNSINELILKNFLDNNQDNMNIILQSLVSADEDIATVSFNNAPNSITSNDKSNKLTNIKSSDKINRQKKEEAKAIIWSINHAYHQGKVNESLYKKLYRWISSGDRYKFEQVKDVLHYRCHLIPAVQPIDHSSNNDKPNPQEVIANDTLISFLDKYSLIDTVDARRHKLAVLNSLSCFISNWVKNLQSKRNPNSEGHVIGGSAVFVAGSYRLGLNDPSSDIDAVCVVPWHVTKDDFFDSFYKLLKNNKKIVTLISAVPNAFVPIISMEYYGVNIDLLFARLPISFIHPETIDIDSDYTLAGVDSASMKSLNAPRTSTLLLSLVPNRRIYRIVLRSVRLWAKKKGIYSSKLGYLGGISWAILVAFICQLYPHCKLPATIFGRFFQILSTWQWPQPILLNIIYDAGLGFDLWDPCYNIYDRAHLMPIITPAYPPMNSAAQVTQATFNVMYEEFWYARSLVELALAENKESPNRNSNELQGIVKTEDKDEIEYIETKEENEGLHRSMSCFESLFTESNFFIRYEFYLVIEFYASGLLSSELNNLDDKNKETNFIETSKQNMHQWSKFVTSRMRKLVELLQQIVSVTRVHPFPTCFPLSLDPKKEFFSINNKLKIYENKIETLGECIFIGLEFRGNFKQKIPVNLLENLNAAVKFFLATDLQQFHHTGDNNDENNKTAKTRLLKWSELPDFVFQNKLKQDILIEKENYENIKLQQHINNNNAVAAAAAAVNSLLIFPPPPTPPPIIPVASNNYMIFNNRHHYNRSPRYQNHGGYQRKYRHNSITSVSRSNLSPTRQYNIKNNKPLTNYKNNDENNKRNDDINGDGQHISPPLPPLPTNSNDSTISNTYTYKDNNINNNNNTNQFYNSLNSNTQIVSRSKFSRQMTIHGTNHYKYNGNYSNHRTTFGPRRNSASGSLVLDPNVNEINYKKDSNVQGWQL